MKVSLLGLPGVSTLREDFKEYFARAKGLGIMREGLGLNMENNEKRESLPYLLKRRGKCRKQVVKFEGNPEKPGLNGGRHKSRWRIIVAVSIFVVMKCTPQNGEGKQSRKIRASFLFMDNGNCEICMPFCQLHRQFTQTDPHHSGRLFMGGG